MGRKFLLLLLVLVMVGSISLAYTWPTESTVVTSHYGPRNIKNGSSDHKGIDIRAREPRDCYAIADGVITYICTNKNGTGGMYVVMDIGNNTVTRYLHLSKIFVTVGQRVKEGEVIAKTGNTGKVNGQSYAYHLHFEVRTGATNPYQALPGNAIDPEPFLKGYTTSSSGSTASNKCIVSGCGGTIADKWYSTEDGKHYKACTKNHDHQYDIGEHSSGKCICGYANLSGSTVSNKCTVTGCGGTIADKWYTTNDGKHYKACTKNHDHQYDIDFHNYKNLICLKCGNRQVITSEDVFNRVYKDLPSSHWATSEIEAMKKAGIVLGDNAGNIRPDEAITIEDFIIFLSRVVKNKNLPQAEGTVYMEKELRAMGAYSADDYVVWARVIGKKTGETEELGKTEMMKTLGSSSIEANIKRYKDKLTREEAAYMIGALGFEANTTVNKLEAKDWNTVNDKFKKRINGLEAKKIFQGVKHSDGSITVNPKQNLTRAEAIALINRLYNVL